ncbi:endonuclease/exonuclease/phosphatase family protein [Alkalimonas delamerensis]|uniref:Endonuclease/exonuclease/phosphatase family protein n=1 Tax=Alkalimonas delamerensis TaxID=265981 RepID=A0ABT9GQY9_9GAMM|nr:endonuclease/exonuclease/phosphatase family protein [Alkalimonas delamerensis]MDP4529385.1 endonuclease/exonuclease/phosphatase family protein [Alkalimonas delamerensis]
MHKNTSSIRVATFNVSMEAENYLPRGCAGDQQVLIARLTQGGEPQIQAIARIIQLTRPDVILLNEFDDIATPALGVEAFVQNYLALSQQGSSPIHYPYYFYDRVNSGQPSPFDLDRNGKATGKGADAWGYGNYPGQYGMLLLSRYPIVENGVRTFRQFKWKDMPGHLETQQTDGSPWYDNDAWQQFPLSSKSHWDIPIDVAGKRLHLFASHPTPPVFDGPERRNAKRNHDEIRFWVDYISGSKGNYIYDDNGQLGGFSKSEPFVVLGDLNACTSEGDAIKAGIRSLLTHPNIVDPKPTSRGGKEHSPKNPDAALHTATWRMRADYVLPSKAGLAVMQSGVFWPASDEPNADLVGHRHTSSDHRLVWVDLRLD